MKPALRFLLTLFTILCCTTISAASIQELQEGIAFEKACVHEDKLGFWADFNAPKRTINNKDIILREFETPKGIVEVAAEARVRGDVLKLKDIAVFPKGADKFDIGAKEVLKIRNGLADEAASQGFRRLRITGERVSGANPGKKVNVKVDLDGR